MNFSKNPTSIKRSLLSIVFTIILTLSLLSFFGGRLNAFQCPDGGPVLPDSATITDCPNTQAAEEFEVDCEPDEGVALDRTNCGIIDIIVIAINFLSAIAGIVFVVSIMISGFQYMTARDNAGQIQKAKSRIISTLIALAIYVFMYALLNFLIPGGIL